jgi:hypothetical protein
MIEQLNLFVPRTVTDSFAVDVKARIDIQDDPVQIYSVYYTGDGEIEFRNGNHYKGDISKGLLHGQGQMLFHDGTLYEGDFHFNKMSGYGQLTWPDGCTYKGDFKDGIRHGHGTFENPLKSSVYEGEWQHGKRHGQGTLRLKDGSVYTGSFAEGVKCGTGRILYPSGNFYEGQWKNGQKNGKGIMHWISDKQKYDGEWRDDLPNGIGTLIWIEESGVNKVLRNRYSGNFVNGLREGLGIFYYANGSTYEGYWVKSKKHGYAMYTNENGEVSHCYFCNDRLVRKIEVSDNLLSSFANNHAIKMKYVKHKSGKEIKTEEGSLRHPVTRDIENTVGTLNSGTHGGTSLVAPPSVSQNSPQNGPTNPKNGTKTNILIKPFGGNKKPGSQSQNQAAPSPESKNPTRGVSAKLDPMQPQQETIVPVPEEESLMLSQNIYTQLIDVADFMSEENSKKLLQSVDTSDAAR